MGRRHRSAWDALEEWTRRTWRVLRIAEYDAIHIIAVSGMCVTAGIIIGRAT